MLVWVVGIYTLFMLFFPALGLPKYTKAYLAPILAPHN